MQAPGLLAYPKARCSALRDGRPIRRASPSPARRARGSSYGWATPGLVPPGSYLAWRSTTRSPPWHPARPASRPRRRRWRGHATVSGSWRRSGRPKAKLCLDAAPTRRAPGWRRQLGKHSEQATYQDLLRDDADDEAFAWFATSQLAWVDPASGETEPVGAPDLFLSVTEAPDGQYLAVTRLCRPFSHRVPYARFGRVTEVLTRRGDMAARVAELPVADEVPRQGVPTGPRRVSWAENQDATLVWLEALDGGDPLSQVEHRDQAMSWTSPFSTEAGRSYPAPAAVRQLAMATRRYRCARYRIRPRPTLANHVVVRSDRPGRDLASAFRPEHQGRVR